MPEQPRTKTHRVYLWSFVGSDTVFYSTFAWYVFFFAGSTAQISG